jgi:selenophosphate synthase
VLILGKPLGVGVLSAALKKDVLDADGYAAMIANTTKLNKPGKALAELDGVHALTDVTGFGLLGHLLELARGAKLTARLDMARSRMPAAAGRARSWPTQGLLHRRVRPQLGRLRQGRRRWRAGVTAGPAACC